MTLWDATNVKRAETRGAARHSTAPAAKNQMVLMARGPRQTLVVDFVEDTMSRIGRYGGHGVQRKVHRPGGGRVEMAYQGRALVFHPHPFSTGLGKIPSDEHVWREDGV